MDVEDLVKSYFRLGFSNKEILCLLVHQHGVIISKRTLQRLCRKLNLFRRKITTSPVLQPGSQRVVALWHIRRRRARRSSTPSGSISLITILIVSWETTYPLRIARRCNHRYPWSRPLVAISDCTKEAISSMSVWFFLRNKLSFLHNRCCCFLWFSLSSLRFLPPGVGLTGSSRPSKVLLEFKALILKTEHKQTLQSVAVLDCIERILIDREDISHLG